MARGPYKTHCKRGHEYTPENTIWKTAGSRNCRACEKSRCRGRKRSVKKNSLRAKFAAYCDDMANQYEKQIAGVKQSRAVPEPQLSKLKAQHWRILAKVALEFKGP
jgi:hypothetical protein